MKIGIIGAGNIGATVAGLAANAGHEVMISNSRGPETLGDVVGSLGSGASAGTIEEAAAYGDVVLEAIPFGHYQDIPAEPLAGKVLISASNYYPDRDGRMDLGGRADTELVAEHLRESRVVKSFNTIWSEHLATQGDTSLPVEDRRVIFLAGDDEGAKELVSGLISEFGFGPFDTGSLHDGGLLQRPGSEIYNVDMTVAQARELVGRSG